MHFPTSTHLQEDAREYANEHWHGQHDHGRVGDRQELESAVPQVQRGGAGQTAQDDEVAEVPWSERVVAARQYQRE